MSLQDGAVLAQTSDPVKQDGTYAPKESWAGSHNYLLKRIQCYLCKLVSGVQCQIKVTWKHFSLLHSELRRVPWRDSDSWQCTVVTKLFSKLCHVQDSTKSLHLTKCLWSFELVMSFVCFLLFIFVTAPDPEAGGAKRSRQGCKEQQTLGLGGQRDEQLLLQLIQVWSHDTRISDRSFWMHGWRKELLCLHSYFLYFNMKTEKHKYYLKNISPSLRIL